MRRLGKAFFLLALCAAAHAQITVNKSNVDAAYKFNTWTTIHTSAGPSPIVSLDLGGSGGSAQSWDFSNITPDPSAGHDTTVQSFITPSGEWHAADFPLATAATKTVQTQQFGPSTATFTFVEYYASEATGFSVLGFVQRQQIAPPIPGFPADTSYFTFFMPKSLFIPVPFTNGTSRASADSVSDSPGAMAYHSKTYNGVGFGNVKFPDGVTRSSLRVSYTEATDRYQDGSFESHSYEHHIVFVAADLTQLDFNVDSSYTVNTANVYDYSFSFQGGTVGVKDQPLPAGFALLQNYPNPFNPSTHIDFSLAGRGAVTLRVYDLLGREVATLVDGELSPGLYHREWNAAGMAGGVYYYVLTTPHERRTRAMIFAK